MCITYLLYVHFREHESIGHKPSAPKTKSKKEKELAKGSPYNRGKHTKISPSPPLSPKKTSWFLGEHKVSYKYNYVKKEMIQPKYVNLAWLKSEGFAFP